MDRQNYLDARSAEMINQFQKRRYNRSSIKHQSDKANPQEREQLFKEKKKDTVTTILLSLKYNRTLPKIKEIVMKHWNLLHINPNLAEIFQNPPILVLRQNKNLRDIIGTKLIENGKVKRKSMNNIQSECTPCLANKLNLVL